MDSQAKLIRANPTPIRTCPLANPSTQNSRNQAGLSWQIQESILESLLGRFVLVERQNFRFLEISFRPTAEFVSRLYGALEDTLANGRILKGWESVSTAEKLPVEFEMRVS